MRFEEAVADLSSRRPARMVPDLIRITALTSLLGDPQRTYPTIHVTGTNGKTTTARLVAELACAHGIPAGLYTSPHLESVTERLSECGATISESDFAEQYSYLAPYLAEVDELGEERVTYFETLTALAYLWFADKPVSLGVFEVGMGGVWDATNLISGDVAVVTPIALDHPELGPTLADKATEKAGIIKQGKVAVVREQPEEAMKVIDARGRDVDARLLLEGIDFSVEDRVRAFGGQLMTVRTPHAVYEELMLPLFGEHSARNAAAAVVAVEAFLDRPLADETTREALARVTSPGRMEVVGRHPLVMLDGAHNPAGATALIESLEESLRWDRLVLVVAVSADKDVPALIEPFVEAADVAVATSYQGDRSLAASELAAVCQAAGIETRAARTMRDALEEARSEAGEGDLILITGSLFAVGEARSALTTRA